MYCHICYFFFILLCFLFFFFFFFQAEDGIRDVAVTGVQTCALPICQSQADLRGIDEGYGAVAHARWFHQKLDLIRVSPWAPSKEEPLDSVQEFHRSEERRVGKECRSRWSAYSEKKKRSKRNNKQER